MYSFDNNVVYKYHKDKFTNYTIENNTCSCPGYLKFSTCKHLKMACKSFHGPSVSNILAYDCYLTLQDSLGKELPELSLDDFPDKATCIKINLSLDTPFFYYVHHNRHSKVVFLFENII